MKKIAAAITLALSTGVMANENEIEIGTAYIDNHPSHDAGGIDIVKQVPGEHKIIVYYSDPALDRCEIDINGLPTNPFKPVNPLTKLQYKGGKVYMNLVTQNALVGHIEVPDNCPESVDFVPNQTIYFWASIGSVPCENGTETCPVEVQKGRYRVRIAKNDSSSGPIKPEPWRGDMGAGGAADVVYDNVNDKYYINWTGVNNIGHVLLQQHPQEAPPQVFGSHIEGFNVRAADTLDTTSLMLIKAKENQVGVIFQPFEDGQMFFEAFYARQNGTTWRNKLSAVDTPEPADSIDVSDYVTFLDTFMPEGTEVMNVFWDYIVWAFVSPDVPIPVGCKVMTDFQGNTLRSFTQGYGTATQSEEDAWTTRFTGKFNRYTHMQYDTTEPPSHLERDFWLHRRFWPKKTWTHIPYGAHYFWSDGIEGESYYGCRYFPLPPELLPID